MADTTQQKINIVKEEAAKEAKVEGRSDTQAQHERTVERIEKEIKKA
jgi:hypothetical protein